MDFVRFFFFFKGRNSNFCVAIGHSFRRPRIVYLGSQRASCGKTFWTGQENESQKYVWTEHQAMPQQTIQGDAKQIAFIRGLCEKSKVSMEGHRCWHTCLFCHLYWLVSKEGKKTDSHSPHYKKKAPCLFLGPNKSTSYYKTVPEIATELSECIFGPLRILKLFPFFYSSF